MTKPADSDQIAKARAFLASRGLADLSLYWPTNKPIPQIDYESGEAQPNLLQLMSAFAESERQAVKEDCCRAVCDRCRIDGPPRDCIGESTATPGDDGGPRFVHLYANGDKLECDAEDIRSME